MYHSFSACIQFTAWRCPSSVSSNIATRARYQSHRTKYLPATWCRSKSYCAAAAFTSSMLSPFLTFAVTQDRQDCYHDGDPEHPACPARSIAHDGGHHKAEQTKQNDPNELPNRSHQCHCSFPSLNCSVHIP